MKKSKYQKCFRDFVYHIFYGRKMGEFKYNESKDERLKTKILNKVVKKHLNKMQGTKEYFIPPEYMVKNPNYLKKLPKGLKDESSW